MSKLCATVQLLAMVGALPAWSLSPRQVAVRFEVAVPALDRPTGAGGRTGLWGAHTPDVVRLTEDALLQRLAQRPQLRHWRFVRDAPQGAAILRVTLREPYADALQLVLELVDPDQAGSLGRLDALWRSAADIGLVGYPAPAPAPAVLAQAVDQHLLERHENTLRNLLAQFVPLASAARWLDTAAPRLVLALRWDEDVALSESVFRLRCEWPNQGRAWLESVGPGLPAPFQPAAPDPPFEGLVVVARAREFAGQRLAVDQVGPQLFELVPREVFLQTYVPAGSWQTGDHP